MKRLLCLLTLCLVLPLTAAAADTEIRVSWWGADFRHKATLECVRLFEKANPGVKIKGEYTGFPGYLDRMTLQISANTEPEMMQLNWAWLGVFSRNGEGFYDINTLKDSIDLSNYDSKWLDMTTIGGKLNAIPLSFTSQVFLLNKTTWDKAGVPLPKTWDDLMAAGRAFKEKLGDAYYPFDALHNGHVYLTNSYIFQKTGHMFVDPKTGDLGLSREELIEAFAFYRKLIESHAIVPLQLRSSISGNMEAPVNENPEYLEGRWAGHYNWDGTITVSAKEIAGRFEVAIADYPTQPGAKNSGHVGRPNMVYAIGKNSKNPAIVAKFINFLVTSPEAAKIQRVDRGVPLSKAALAVCIAENLIDPLSRAGAEQLSSSDVHIPHPNFENSRVLLPLMRTIEQLSHGQISPEEAADNVERELPRTLTRLKRGAE